MGRYGGYYGFAPYVPVAVRKAKAAAKLQKMLKKGEELKPVQLEGRTIARTFWGKAWCDNLESYMDYENRLPRGRSYVRNGSVLHLEISPGLISAKVAGSSLYTVDVRISPVAKPKWEALCEECAGRIGSLLELLSGKMSNEVMRVMTQRETGLFPSPKEIQLDCSCPDWADMCKHVAAVLYGVGARLDSQPELLFLLRGVDHNDLITQAVSADITAGDATVTPDETVDAGDLADVFGIDLDLGDVPAASAATTPAKPAPTAKKAAAKRTARKTSMPKKKAVKKTAKKSATPTAKKPLATRKKKTAPEEPANAGAKVVATPAAKAAAKTAAKAPAKKVPARKRAVAPPKASVAKPSEKAPVQKAAPSKKAPAKKTMGKKVVVTDWKRPSAAIKKSVSTAATRKKRN